MVYSLALFLSLLSGIAAQAGQIVAFVEPNAGRLPFTREFDQARKSIDVFAFTLTDRPIAEALGSAAARGVAVRVLLEPCSGDSNCTRPVEEAALACGTLLSRGVQVKWANPAFVKTHAKAILIDGTRALITTVNLEPESFTKRRDYGLVTEDRLVIADFSRAFAQDWQKDKPLENCSQLPSARRPEATVQRYDALIVSPDHAREQIFGLIRSARSSVKIEMEQVVKSLLSPLTDAAKAGVKVQVLIAEKDERNRNDNAAAAIRAAGGEAQIQKKPKIHAKMILVDGQRVFIGSQNLTKTSLDERREVGWVTADPATLACFSQVFDADWEGKQLDLGNGICPQPPARFGPLPPSAGSGGKKSKSR